MNENYTINELLHNMEQEDTDKQFCKIISKWLPKRRKLMIVYEDNSNYEYSHVLKILDRGRTERIEHFKSYTEMGKRYMEILYDYYGKNIIYENEKRKSLELKFIISYNDNKEVNTIYDGFILKDYEV